MDKQLKTSATAQPKAAGEGKGGDVMDSQTLLLVALVALICSIIGIKKEELALKLLGQLFGVLVVLFIIF